MSSVAGGALLAAAGEIVDGRYRVDRVLGSGGMGYVVAAWHLGLDEPVALKFLRPSVLGHPGVAARFAREAQAAAKIRGEHVCRVLDVGRSAERGPYMVMEYLEGEDLGSMLDRSGPLGIDTAVRYVLQACEALAEAHKQGIVHRDLKPANLFLTRRLGGQPLIKLLDFGISKTEQGSQEQRLTMTDTVMGSFAYASPEHVRNVRDVDCRTDVWALGVVVFELLTGALPFPATTQAELIAKISADPPLPLRAARPDAPEALEAVLLTCLEKQRDRRYPGVAELAVDLAPFAPGTMPIVGSILRIAHATATDSSVPPLVPPAESSRAASSEPADARASPPQPAAQADLAAPTMASATELSARRPPLAPAAEPLPGATVPSESAPWPRQAAPDELAGDTLVAARAARPVMPGASTVAPWWSGQERATANPPARVIGAAAAAVVALALAIAFLVWPRGAEAPAAGDAAPPSASAEAPAVDGEALPPLPLDADGAPSDASSAPTGSAEPAGSAAASSRPTGGSASRRPSGKARPPAYRYR